MVIALAESKSVRPYRELGRRIKALRQSARLTQHQLAAAVNISSGYPGPIEGGTVRPDPDILRRIAAVTGGRYAELAALAGYADDDEAETDEALNDPELDLLFRQLKDAELPESDMVYVKETIRLALKRKREREAGER